MNAHGKRVIAGTGIDIATLKEKTPTAGLLGKYLIGSTKIMITERIARNNFALSMIVAETRVQQALLKNTMKQYGMQERRVTAPLVVLHAKPLLEAGHGTRKMNGEKNQQIVEDIAVLAQLALPMDGLKAFLESNTITFSVKISNGSGAPGTQIVLGAPVNDGMYASTYTNETRGDSHGFFNIPPIVQKEVKAGSLEIDIAGGNVIVSRPSKPKASYGADLAAALSDFLDIFKSFVPKA